MAGTQGVPVLMLECEGIVHVFEGRGQRCQCGENYWAEDEPFPTGAA